ncbi:hypothetical protein AMELA_G00121780 [Ameiurus melas]|uniref:Uncharacterized protein n=1 Tax=Ameiurus melas TaxID=219545 RepID=A0A7J6AMM0_AMEME|nr:hypothetical protein AMELA_G00121780 [Ameiurus melas]
MFCEKCGKKFVLRFAGRSHTIQCTCDAAEQSQAGNKISFTSFSCNLLSSGWDRNCYGDGLMKLPPPGFYGYNGAE